MRQVQRYRTNPFLEDLVIQKKGKMVKISRLGEENNVLVNQTTGEVAGTHIIAYKQVDKEQFIKLFTQNIALTFDLTSAGIKALNVVAWIVQHEALNKDIVPLGSYSIEEFNNHNSKKINIKTFYRGLSELEKNKIVAKHTSQGLYFINPNFIFNGDRIAFTTLIERKRQQIFDFDDTSTQLENF